MGPSPKKPVAIDARGQRPRDGHASSGEKRRSSGTNSGDWLVNVSEDVVVPMTTSEIVDGLRGGKLSQRSLVWRIGMHDWTIMSDVPQLRLAAGSAGSASSASSASSAPSIPPASSPRVIEQQATVQGESQRRRNTLPFGFPAQKDPASVRQPAGLAASTPLSAPRISSLPAAPRARHEESDALAIYDRPAASLTFADSVRAEWQGTARLVNQAAPSSAASGSPKPSPDAPKLTPVPAVAARLQQNLRSNFPSSLVPTTAEATPQSEPRGPGAWGDLSVVLASDFRAAKASSRRVAIWAALASAVVASVFTVWLVRSPEAPPHAASDAALDAPHAAARPVEAPAAAATLEAPPLPATATAVASAAPVPKSALAPRPAARPALTRPRVKAAAPATAAAPAPATAAVAAPPESDNPYSEPSAPAAAAPSPTPSVEAAPTPAAKAEPSDPSGL